MYSNTHYPVFAIKESDLFIWIDEIVTSIDSLLKLRKINHEFLKPEFLHLKFYNRNEYDNVIKKLSFDVNSLKLTLELLNLERCNYRLFYGENVGYNLFNGLED